MEDRKGEETVLEKIDELGINGIGMEKGQHEIRGEVRQE